MKHLIIGSGVIGKATGIWLLANKHDVYFNDINKETLKKLEYEGYSTTEEIRESDVYWICTAEWNVEEAIKNLRKISKHSLVIVRSTTSPGTMDKLQKNNKNLTLIHNPEFLVQNNATFDIFNPDRIILGGKEHRTLCFLENFFKKMTTAPIIKTDFNTSEMIKLTANCWLASQISFWNEIKTICEKLKINPQEVANAVTLDKRISKYGSIMVGKPYSGFCLPKDTKTMEKLIRKHKVKGNMIKAAIKTNGEI